MNDQIQNSFSDISNKLVGWVSAFIENLPNIGIALLVMIISYFMARYTSRLVDQFSSKYFEQKSMSKLISRITAIAVVMGGLFLALGVLDLGKTLNTLLAGAGISGLVIGLALQGTLSNLISGVALSLRKNIRIGHWVETNGFAGEVMDIKLYYFILKEADNNMVIIPNKAINDNPIKNFSLTTKMRIMIECGVGYESDLDLVEQLTKETIAKAFDQIKSPEDVEFFYTEFGGSAINFVCRFWVDSENSIEKLRATSKGIIEIKKAFDTKGINIPFPIRTLQFDNKLNILNGASKHAIASN
jgi:small conductance mechanosensitive channel